jgi:hypothetical protein
MGEYCPSPQEDSALVAAPLTRPSSSPETAVRPSYGSCDRRYVKQVFDNLHGSISLDPVSSAASLLPYPFLASLLLDWLMILDRVGPPPVPRGWMNW